MNKKQKNRKDVAQNKRNRMINRRYSSTIKSLTKLFKSKIKNSVEDLGEENKITLKKDTSLIMNNLYSFIDKACIVRHCIIRVPVSMVPIIMVFINRALLIGSLL